MNGLEEFKKKIGAADLEPLPCFLAYASEETVDVDLLKRSMRIGEGSGEGAWKIDSWMKKWQDDKTELKEEEDEEEHVNKLLRYGLFKSNDNIGGYFFSFCRGKNSSQPDERVGSWQQTDGTLHCRGCNECRIWLDWHCGRCGKCTFDINLPCGGCGGVAMSFDMESFEDRIRDLEPRQDEAQQPLAMSGTSQDERFERDGVAETSDSAFSGNVQISRYSSAENSHAQIGGGLIFLNGQWYAPVDPPPHLASAYGRGGLQVNASRSLDRHNRQLPRPAEIVGGLSSGSANGPQKEPANSSSYVSPYGPSPASPSARLPDGSLMQSENRAPQPPQSCTPSSGRVESDVPRNLIHTAPSPPTNSADNERPKVGITPDNYHERGPADRKQPCVSCTARNESHIPKTTWACIMCNANICKTKQKCWTEHVEQEARERGLA